MTNCCRKCSKKFCEKRDTVEDCKDCVSFVLLAFREIDKKLEWEERRKNVKL
jgi:hypothetical protein